MNLGRMSKFAVPVLSCLFMCRARDFEWPYQPQRDVRVANPVCLFHSNGSINSDISQLPRNCIPTRTLTASRFAICYPSQCSFSDSLRNKNIIIQHNL